MSKIKKIVPLLGIAILVYLVVRVGAWNIISAILGAEVIYLLPALLLVIPYLILQTYKWQYIVRNQGIDLGFSYLLKVYIISTFWSIITPGKLGTFSRIAYIKKETGKDIGESGSGVVLDKIVDMFTLFILAIIGAVLLIGHVSDTILLMIMVLFVAFVGASALLMKRSTSKVFMKFVYRFLMPQKLKSSAHQSFNSFYKSVPPLGLLVVPFIATILSWVAIYSADYLVALSFGIDVPWHIFITLFPIATIVGLIPITVSGWGTREAMLIALLSPFAAAAESVIAMSIIIFIITGLPQALLGVILSFSEK